VPEMTGLVLQLRKLEHQAEVLAAVLVEGREMVVVSAEVSAAEVVADALAAVSGVAMAGVQPIILMKPPHRNTRRRPMAWLRKRHGCESDWRPSKSV